ncbi:MAG TPA: GntR family transcriptional regulator [Bryobacteraceae bacterium]|nr:GntR family transcriptional regulator [Bryobacteraceae bacterium]
MIPFRVALRPGAPIYEQVVYAAKKAILSGEMAPGERFPSVRALSQSLKINPNTAHKVIGELVAERLLEVQPGLGTVVAIRSAFSAADRAHLLKTEVEHLVVEAKRLGITREALLDSVADHWRRLGPEESVVRGKR